MTSEELFQQVKDIVGQAMNEGYKRALVEIANPPQVSLDELADEWDYEVDHYAQEIMGVVGA